MLANLAYAAWQTWYAEDGQPVVATLEREFGDIMLAREFAEANPGLDVAPARPDLEALAGTVAQPDATEPGVADPAESALLAEATLTDADGSSPAADEPDAGEAAAESAIDGGTADPESETDPIGAEGSDEALPAFRADPEILPEPDPGQQFAAARTGIPGGVCMSVGPFSELGQVTAAAANLREDGFAPRQRVGEGEIWAGYWVYIERIDSVAAARPMLEPLHDAGLEDAYIIPDSDSGILISLGIFSEIVRASRVREQVRELGFEATIADRVRSATVFWIDVDLPPGDTLDFERLQPPGRIVRLEQRPCEEVPL